MGRLSGKVVVVTGASAGIGRAAVQLFAAEGAQVVAGARRGAELDRLVSAVTAAGGELVALAGDVRDERYAQALADLAIQAYGRLDLAFNNAGVLGTPGPSTELSQAAWDEVLAVNLTGAFLSAKHQLAHMAKQGSGAVLFTSSFVGYSAAFPGVAAYAASKAGLVGLTQALAAEFGPQGIRVNALLPGATDTDMYRGMNSTVEAQSFVKGLHALKRVASPLEVAQAALYLLSPDASFVTGAALLVDGGVSITRT